MGATTVPGLQNCNYNDANDTDVAEDSQSLIRKTTAPCETQLDNCGDRRRHHSRAAAVTLSYVPGDTPMEWL